MASIETLIDLLVESTTAHPERIALSTQAGLRTDAWSYGRLWSAANAIARHLRMVEGLRPGDRVLVSAPNSPRLVAALFGTALARVVLTPLDTSSSRDFIARVAAKTGAAALIAGDPNLRVPGARTISLDEMPFDDPGPTFDERPTADDLVEIVFTSGTTGEPKGVPLTHGNIVANVRSVTTVVPGTTGYRMLSILPLSHMLEQTLGLFLPLHYGWSVHYPAGRQAPSLLRTLRRYRIGGIVLVPGLLHLLMRGIEREIRRQGKWRGWRRAQRLAPWLPGRVRRWLFRDVHRSLGGHLAWVVCGGAYLAPEAARLWQRLGVMVVEGYGVTECAPVVIGNSFQEHIPGTIGRPLRGVEVRLSDEAEIQVKGANVMAGYWQDPEATASAFTDDGWYRTGDLAEWTDAGRIVLRGRLKDLIVLSNGMNVYPEDVERVLSGQDGILDCVAIGKPDPAGAMHVHAVVRPASEDGNGRARVEAAIREANRRLAPHQRIGGHSLWLDGDFPRTLLQKVKRYQVRERIARSTTPAASETAATADEEDAFARLRQVLAEVSGVDPATITPETDIHLELALDSLAQLELAALVEERFGVTVEEARLDALKSAGDLAGVVEAGETVAPPEHPPDWPLSRAAALVRGALQRVLVFPLHGLLCRPYRIEGREHLRGVPLPALLIANHASHVDTPSVLRALPAGMRRRTAVAAATDYFYRFRAVGALMSLLLNTFPFARRDTVRDSLEYCGELIDAGWSILIYPEGTRSASGRLQPFKSGIGLLATGLCVPVVPIAVEGTHAILPKGRGVPRRGRVTVRFGAPIHLDRDADATATVARLERAVGSLLPAERRCCA